MRLKIKLTTLFIIIFLCGYEQAPACERRININELPPGTSINWNTKGEFWMPIGTSYKLPIISEDPEQYQTLREFILDGRLREVSFYLYLYKDLTELYLELEFPGESSVN